MVWTLPVCTAARFFSLWSLGALAACGLNSAPHLDDGRSDLYFGFTLLDPAGETVQENAYVVVTDGRIAAIGDGEPPQGAFRSRRDFTGRFALPGFVDAHAHITAGPTTVERVDGTPVIKMESVDEITQYHARVALAFGVTTIRNPGGDPAANARYDARIRAGAWVGPDAVHAGAPVQPPPFGGNAFVYPRSDPEWHAAAQRQADLGMKYLKLYVSLGEDELATGIRVAHQHGLRAIAHLDNVSWTRALQLGIDELTHALPTSADLLPPASRQIYLAERGADSRFMYRWFELVDLDRPPVTELIQLLVQMQTRVDLTLVVNQLIYNVDNVGAIVPVAERRFVHPIARESAERQLRASTTGWTAADYSRARAVMPKVLEFARRLYQAGVPLMIGTDGYGGSPMYARELQLHVDAGIPAWDVLRLATSEGARLLGLADETGRFRVGLQADFVFLNAHPIRDIANVKQVHTVVTNGTAYSFEQLAGAAVD